MYIIYDRDQWRICHECGILERPGKSPNELYYGKISIPPQLDDIYRPQDASSFKPAKLIRISDMQVVLGSDVRERYYTLSYSWNQSGDYFKNEHDDEYTRVDHGKHEVVFYRKRKARKHPRGRTKTRISGKPRLVNFEGLIQQICKDFGVKYLWWDQMCIDQTNPEEKRHEIKQMHRIYKNSYCTLALIPELDFTGRVLSDGKGISNTTRALHSEWGKRVWTLEEAFMSKRLLFIGRNVHMFSHIFNYLDSIVYIGEPRFLDNLCRKSIEWNAAIALQYSRKRTSTKPHDRYFALANIFPDKLKNFEISYDRPLNDLALQFYQCIASNDPSILFFGAPEIPDTDDEKEIVQRPENDFLPSWTGVNGAHGEKIFTEGNPGISAFGILPRDYTVSGTSIYLTCASISVNIEKGNTNGEASSWWQCIPGKLDSPVQSSYHNRLTFVERPPEVAMKFGCRVYKLKATHAFPLKEESGLLVNTTLSPDSCGGIIMSLTENCDRCTILVGMCYTGIDKFSPVVTKDGDHYKSIGLCVFIISDPQSYFTNIDLKTKKTFEIK